MIGAGSSDRVAPRRERRFVVGVQVLAVALVAGWFGTGHASAPDDGLLQLDVLSLHEKVPGVGPVDDRPTMVVLAGRCASVPSAALPASYRLVVHRVSDPGYLELLQRLALPAAARRCQPGYVLVDRAGYVRYRTYDPGWAKHADEQSVLLAAL